ncbi:hypothetical protein FRB99_008676 [Tulasnella sp. 403]|nr:hypothetical protein FRB99_008676 [Tulasnella sp. 403]
MPVLIGMRSLQAVGASVAFTLASASIADMYDTHERGTRVGIYYAVPLLGPSVGPMLGGVLIQVWNWRATFWFMAIFGGLSIILCFFLKESFRKERSLVYQAAKTRASSRGHSRGHSTLVSRVPSRTNVKASVFADAHVPQGDVEKGIAVRPHQQTEEGDVKVTLADVNPIRPALQVLKQRSNVAILFASGSMFGFNYGICYTCARTFAAPPYSYDALEVGAILLSFGLGMVILSEDGDTSGTDATIPSAGNVGGSLLGGRWSDRILVRLKAANGGVGKPEMRLQSTTIAMLVLPFAVIAYGWTAHFYVNVAAPAVALFIAGFALFWGYSSTLAYIVDSNPGRASSATAMNSCFRGLAGLVVAEVSAPIQDAIGDGGLYSIWAGILFAVAGLLAYVSRKGADWRQKEEQKRLEKELHALQLQRQQTEQAH